MTIKRAKIDTFDGGMISSDRSANFTDGAALVSHFDIYKDPKKLYPVPSFERWNTDDERAYQLTALDFDASTSSADTIYATGRYMKNWAGMGWGYRAKLTPSANVTGYTSQMGIDLSRLGSDFWNNVEADGSDILVAVEANGIQKFIPTDVVGLDVTNQKGWLFFNSQSLSSTYTGVTYSSIMYMYWGNSSTDVSSETNKSYSSSYGQRNAYVANMVYQFDDTLNDELHNGFPGTTADLSLTENSSSESPLYYTLPGNVAGTVSTFLTTTETSADTFSSDNDSTANDYPGGNNGISISFNIYMSGYPASTTTLINIAGSSAYVSITNTGTVQFTIDRDGAAPVTITSGSAISLNTLTRVRCEYQKNVKHNIYLNGAISTTGTVRTEGIEPMGGVIPAMVVIVDPSTLVQNIIVEDGNSDATAVKALQDYKMLFDNANMYTIGGVETFASVTKQYGGLTIYKKLISDTAWSNVYYYGMPLQIDSNTPMGSGSFSITVNNPLLYPHFIRYEGLSIGGAQFTIPFTNTETDSGATQYVLVINNEDLTSPDNGIYLTGFTGSLTYGIRPSGFEAISGLWYFGSNTSSLWSSDGGTPASAFSAYPIISSIDNKSGYLVIGGFRDNKSFVQLWDRSSSVSSQFIDFGLGWLKNVGVIKGDVIAVIDGFIDNADKSAGRPYLEVRRWTGDTTYDTPARIVLPTTFATEFTEKYLSPIYNKKVYTKNAMAFYAKLPVDEALTTFNEGFYAVGKNETTGKLSLSILYNTDRYGKVIDYTAAANNVYFSTSTNDIYKLSTDTFNQTSRYETLKFTGDLINIKKKLHAVEISTEALGSGQIITLFYKKDNDTSWTEIGTFDTVDGINKEFLKKVDGTNFPEFKEIQFAFESTGGSSPITEFAFRYEELATKV